MAFGVASLAILGVNDVNLVSVDPKQTEHYQDAGLDAIARAGFSQRHRLVHRPSYEGLPALLGEGLRLQFAYIDGWHTFDYVLLDFFYIDKMLDVGGVVAFNDCWMPSVDRVVAFALSHRDYEEIDVGLRRGKPKREMLHRRPGRQHEDRYLRKVTNHEPAWDFYHPF